LGWSAAGSTFAQSQSTKKALEEKSEREVGCWVLAAGCEKRGERKQRSSFGTFFKGSI